MKHDSSWHGPSRASGSGEVARGDARLSPKFLFHRGVTDAKGTSTPHSLQPPVSCDQRLSS
jgi:hypothetical protein